MSQHTKRDQWIRLRVNAVEREAIIRNARAARMTISEYIRSRTMQSA